MPNNLTDKEIKKALECCRDIDIKCETCQLWTDSECTKVLHQATIDLINRQEEQINSLQELCENITDQLVDAKDNLLTAKAEAYKECIEKVKKLMEGWGDLEYYSDVIKAETDLDNLLNELVGENNG